MAIPALTANTALSLVNALVRLGGRIDRLRAEDVAVRSDLALPSKQVIVLPSVLSMKSKLQALLDDTAGSVPDPLAGRREQIARALDGALDQHELFGLIGEFLPADAFSSLDAPDRAFLDRLRARGARWGLDDEAITRVAFYVNAGEDLRASSLPWQIAMTVADVLADLALEHQSLLLREDRARPMLRAVIERFAAADLITVGSTRLLLRTVLDTTIHATLDSPDAVAGDNALLGSLLAALAHTRDQAGDDFVVALFQGSGYPLLVGNVLGESADLIGAGQVGTFERITADVLHRAATIARGRRDFDAFFRDHWGTLLRGALASVRTNGERLLDGQSPLLRETLLASLDVLADAAERDFLSGDAVSNAVEAALGAVALKPALLHATVGGTPWLQQVLTSVAGVLSQDVGNAITPAGREQLLQQVLADLARQPELLVGDGALVQSLVGDTLHALASTGRPRLDLVAATAVQTTLAHLAEHPDLLNTRYAAVITAVARELTASLDDRRLTRGELVELLVVVGGVVAEQPQLLIGRADTLAARALGEALGVLLDRRGRPVSADTLREVAHAVLVLVAAEPGLFEGREGLAAEAARAFLDQLTQQLGQTAPDLRFSTLATAGLVGLLEAAASHPGLIVSTRYADAVGRVAGQLALALADGRVTRDEAVELVQLIAGIVARNLEVLVAQHPLLAAELVRVSLDTLVDNAVRGDALTELLDGVLAVLAARVNVLLGTDTVGRLIERVNAVLTAGLERIRGELGHTLEAESIAPLLIGLVQVWADDGLSTLDIDDLRFRDVFDELLDAIP